MRMMMLALSLMMKKAPSLLLVLSEVIMTMLVLSLMIGTQSVARFVCMSMTMLALMMKKAPCLLLVLSV